MSEALERFVVSMLIILLITSVTIPIGIDYFNDTKFNILSKQLEEIKQQKPVVNIQLVASDPNKICDYTVMSNKDLLLLKTKYKMDFIEDILDAMESSFDPNNFTGETKKLWDDLPENRRKEIFPWIYQK